jgi:hypothetical protein
MSGTVSDNTSQSSGSVTEAAGGVSIVSSDPTLTEGLLWYNSTSNVLKVARNVSAWASGGDLGTLRAGLGDGSNGTQSACFVAGGSNSGGRLLTSETYNGSAWSAQGDMTGNGRTAGGTWGTSAAGAQAGGSSASGVISGTNLFDGTSWSDPSDALSTVSYAHGSCGTQNAAISRVGGHTGSAKMLSCEEYNGSDHVSGGNISSIRSGPGVCGTLTSAISAGATASDTLTTCETYDGTSWSSSTALATARGYVGAFGASDSDANVSGGESTSGGNVLNSCELWNGTSWSAGDTLTVARKEPQGAGNASTSGLITGGNAQPPGTDYLDTTEEYSEALTARTLSNS